MKFHLTVFQPVPHDGAAFPRRSRIVFRELPTRGTIM
jgi:hypothetical protein